MSYVFLRALPSAMSLVASLVKKSVARRPTTLVPDCGHIEEKFGITPWPNRFGPGSEKPSADT